MRTLSRLVFLGLSLLATPMALQAQDLIPAKRFALSENTDLPGGDLASIFDTDLNACERACMTNNACQAFTFNTTNGSCFPKSASGEGAYFEGAMSGTILLAQPGVAARAGFRRGEITFLPDWDVSAATEQAADIGNQHTTNGYSAEEHLQSAADSENSGDYIMAANFTGAALVLTDSGAHWAEYARRLLLAATQDTNQASWYQSRAFNAAINAYLRSENPALRHSILVTMADAAEKIGRGRDTVNALRLAQELQPRDDTAALLDDAIGKYGFRILETVVQSESTRPRVCANFSEDLVATGVDYSTFVQLPEPGLTVVSGEWRQLCIEGIEFGKRYAITFREGLPAADGQTMAKSVEITQYIRDRSPGVRFSGRGYVLPKTGNVAIPVETVNTESLELVLYKVSDRNILRSIQNSYFGAPMGDWQTYDFANQVAAQVWTGTATVQQDVNKDVTTRLPMEEALKDLPAGIYALEAKVPGVDPYTIPSGWQWFVVSDLGMTTMTATDGLHVFVRSLGDASAKTGVTVELLSRANEVLGTATTDAQGYARFDAGLVKGTDGAAPSVVVAKSGAEDISFLSLTDPEFDLSDRGVEGREAAGSVDVFLTTDRGAYRAGETIYATALTRDADTKAVEGLPLTAILYRPDGVEYSRAQVQDGGKGGHVFSMPVAGSAPRGVWRLAVMADLEGAELASQSVLVEDFLPERIDFELSLPEGILNASDTPELTVAAKYLFGAPGAGLNIEGEVYLTPTSELPDYPGYRFGKHDSASYGLMQSFDGGYVTDDQGNAVISTFLPELPEGAGPFTANFNVRVAEGSGRPVERRESRTLAPGTDLIGIKPLFDDVVPEGAEARFSLMALDAGLAPTAMQVKWRLNRIDTRYQWYQNYGNWSWEPVVTRELKAEGVADIGTTPVEIAAAVQWGEYELVVERTVGDAPLAASTTFWAGWYAPADASATPDTLELSLDKPAYKPGETANLRVVPRAAGTALVTVLSNRLVSMQAVQVKEGENLIPLAVTDEWGAGVYVTVSAIRPMDVAAGRNPARALGLTYASIDPGARQLKATVEMPDEVAPRGPFEVAVKVDGVEAGDQAYVTIAAVDVGILNLTGFESPDPSDYYFGQRKLGVGIRDVYGRLIDGLNGAEGTVRSGGDAGLQAGAEAPPPTEELVAYFSGPVAVTEDGYAKASFTMPSFNGTVRVMAVAWSGKGIGQAEKDVFVRDPVVVTASVPRFMAPGDTSRLLLEVVHATGPSGRMGLDVTANGLTLGTAPSGVDLVDKGKAVIEVPVTAGDVGNQTISISLTTPDGKVLKKDLIIPVQANDPIIARVSRLDLAKGQTFTFGPDVFAGLLPNSGKATLAVGPIAKLNAPGLLQALDQYPYGCTEQMTSKALPLLYFDQVASAMQLKGADNIRTRVDQAITEILQNQTAEGAFGLWYAYSGDMWLDAYVTDFLSRARAQGFTVPDVAFRNALDNLRNQVNYHPDFDQGGEALAYALMVLAREGAAAVGDLRYYADVKPDAFSTALAQAQLGAALASYGDQPRADAMFTRAAARLDALSTPEKEQIFRADYGTNYRDSAAVLALALEAGTKAVDATALTERLARQGDYLSTQEATWALLATNALLDGPGLEGVTIDGKPADGPLVRVLDAGASTAAVIKNDSQSNTYLTVTTYGVPVEPEPAGGNGYAITRSYFTMDGQPVDLSQPVKAGTRLVTVLEVTPWGRGEARLMVNDPLPAGFEIDNPNLMAAGSTSQLGWLDAISDVANSEFRQERFLTAVDRYDNATFKLAYVVRAISPGTYKHPAASVEDMYRPDFRARSETGAVTVTP
jgi:alpha-2-macroglobulin